MSDEQKSDTTVCADGILNPMRRVAGLALQMMPTHPDQDAIK
ncbi:hypothetical protein [Xylella taiwanensis]|uniref:Uncharacterized protein n=1 Tax=Xylella taiwanensis TaxID=1444770 RepID=Z9JJA3_9GAMM|nr:hypothetical protein [Xylella taiwanensis]EWS78480.1 hypothetical protein AF72_05335 [Xylella taiwanensis]